MAEAQRIPFARMSEYRPRHPDRTAYRMTGSGLNMDVTVKEFPSRGAMLQTIHMQESGASYAKAWRDWSSSRWNKGEGRAKLAPDGASHNYRVEMRRPESAGSHHFRYFDWHGSATSEEAAVRKAREDYPRAEVVAVDRHTWGASRSKGRTASRAKRRAGHR